MVTMSESRNSSSLLTRRAPHSAARSAVRFWLQATRFMRNTLAISAIWAPRRPRPTMPRVRLARSWPRVDCQRPSRMARSSKATWRTAAMMSAPDQLDRRAAAAGGAADDHLVVARRRQVDGQVPGPGGAEQAQLGQPLEHGPRERRPLAHQDDDVERLEERGGGFERPEMPAEDGDFRLPGERRPVGHRQGDSLIVVEDCNLHDAAHTPDGLHGRKRAGDAASIEGKVGLRPFSFRRTAAAGLP